jgi:hypothetical protein
MSNGGGGDGGCGFHAVISAARAIDPNDVTARLNAAPMQAAANFLESMTLPLCYPCCPIHLPALVRRHAKCSFRAALRGSKAESITDIVDVGSTQSSPDCVVISRKPCANRRKPGAAVAKVSHQRERVGDSMSLKNAANLGSASPTTDTTTSKL